MRKWENKYLHRVEKHVEIDHGDINVKEKMDNDLSKRIREVHENHQSEASNKINESLNLVRETPDILGFFPLSKKVKISPGKDSALKTRAKPKTKHELNVENSNLTLDLRMTLLDLGEQRRQNVSLQEELSQSKKNIESLLKKQAIFVDMLQEMMSKLSPDKQNLYQEQLSGLEVENLKRQLQQVTTYVEEKNACPTAWSNTEQGTKLTLEIDMEKQTVKSKSDNQSVVEEMCQTFLVDNHSPENAAADDNKTSSFYSSQGSPQNFNSPVRAPPLTDQV
ncbi:MAG: hypothetical protein ACQUHE_16935, partial [Bacteroidia bacterium]